MKQPTEALVDVLLRNARIWTGDTQQWAQALVVRDGRIAWMGDDAEAAELAGVGTDVIDGGGRLVLPGFVDAHNHLRLGTGADAVHLGGAQSLDDIHARIGRWLSSNPDATWVYGETWEYPRCPEGVDHVRKISSGRPAADLPSCWISQSTPRG